MIFSGKQPVPLYLCHLTYDVMICLCKIMKILSLCLFFNKLNCHPKSQLCWEPRMMAQDKEANANGNANGNDSSSVLLFILLFILLSYSWKYLHIVALTHAPGSLFHSFIVRWENAYFLMSNLHRSLANALDIMRHNNYAWWLWWYRPFIAQSNGRWQTGKATSRIGWHQDNA